MLPEVREVEKLGVNGDDLDVSTVWDECSKSSSKSNSRITSGVGRLRQFSKYSSCFFKKSWQIVGEEMCKAIKEFFITGKILGEINATLIALVPKIDTPEKVSDFRPIACCNVIYKIISKILTNRIKNGLRKIGNMNQSAFIPGRHIQDNILIAQELLKGYNRKSGSRRCAMKIDLQKAYDTISWDFIKDVLSTVGFHDTMINWIMTCITTTKFSICVNGEIKGIIKVVKKSMDEFSSVSGLFSNLNKSTIFFGNVIEEEKTNILQILPFKCGVLSMKYLGVPLLAKRLGVSDCKCLIDNVENRITCWKNKHLSYAGRIQLIASVLSAMQ
ncbi:RNA-directed DNA polymerase, eukaryota, reverse transcriptase zinc-binding domain protein [Tanacetum coccineum]